MSRILIWRKPIPWSDIDIFQKTDYRMLYEKTVKLYGYANGINYGNRVWYQGICSVIDCPGNTVTYRTTESTEEINDRYDLIIYPMANFFSKRFCRDTSDLVRVFSGIRIPVFVISCGAQADSYDQLDDLIASIGDPAKRFIEAIYTTGGEFALRGYFTKEFFALLGFSGAVVTGCPSLYQIGPDLLIEKKTNLQPSRLLINGRIKQFESILKSVPDSIFMDQDSFIDCLFDSNYFSTQSIKKDILFYADRSIVQAELLGENRIRLFPNVGDWFWFLKKGNYEYSFGTKIHGSIMPILAGIPASVVGIDSRTQEMAEFFEIPLIPYQKEHMYSVDELYSAYESADYSAFNAHFREKYYAFESFLQRNGIVEKINNNNRFLQEDNNCLECNYFPNQQKFIEYSKKLKREQILLRIGESLLKKKNERSNNRLYSFI